MKSTTTIEPPCTKQLAARLFWLTLSLLVSVGVIVLGYRTDHLLLGFYSIMGAVFTAGLVGIGYGVRRFSVERRAQSNLLEQLCGSDLWPTIRSWRVDSNTWRVLFGLSEQQFIDPGSIRDDGFLYGMHKKLSAPASFVKTCGDVLVSLGLLGTAAGLAAMLLELQAFAASGQLVAGDGGGRLFEQLFGAEGPLRQLGASFSTSVVGFAGRIALWTTSMLLHSGADRLTDYLGDTISMNIAPAVKGSEA